MVYIKKLFSISRPIFWSGPFFICLAGILAADADWNFLTIWSLFFVTFPMGLIVYGLNDIADRESDAKNSRKGGVEGYIVKTREIHSILIVTIFSFLIFAISFLLGGKFFSLIILISILLFAYVYSFKPIRLKRIPIVDSFSNGFWMLTVFLLGFSLKFSGLQPVSDLPKVSWIILLAVTATHALTTLWDLKIDRQSGDHTIGNFLTLKGTLLFSLLIYLLIILLLPLSLSILTYLIICIFLCLFMLFKPATKILHHSVWVILLGFPLLGIYLVLFEYNSLVRLLK